MATALPARTPATWEEYVALGEDVRAEYIEGEIVVPPLPTQEHQTVCWQFAALLKPVLPPGFRVNASWGWKPGKDEFGPDVMVYATADVTSEARFTGVPVLCIEVLSTNRSTDRVTKLYKYAEAGLDHYWIVDLRDGVMDVLVRDGGQYRLARQVLAEEPSEVSFGIAGVVVDLNALTT